MMPRGVDVDTSDRGRILVVDDDRSVRAVASIRLRESGYDVVEAANGNVALERVSEGGIDVVILDAMMPEMDGFQVLARLQLLEHHPGIILLTAMNESDARVRELYGGAVEFIGKPFEPADFLAKIALAVTKHRLLQDSGNETRSEESCEKSPDPDHFNHGKGAEYRSVSNSPAVQRLIPGMLADMTIACRSAEAAQTKDDLHEIESLGHRIKGTSRVFGFQTLSALAEALEVSAQAMDRVAIRKIVEQLTLHVRELITNTGAIIPR